MLEEIRESSVVAGGVRFHYATAGRGPLVLLLHGFPERWFSWRAQIPALARAGFRVVAPDLRGYGLSERPATGYTLPALADDVAALIAALGEDEAAVVGHDWGGAITWEAAARHPRRVTRYAVLNCPRAQVLFEEALASREQLARSGYILFFNIPWLPERLLTRDGGEGVLRRMRAMGGAVPPALDESVRGTFASPETLRPALAYYREAARRAFSGGLRHAPVLRQPGLLVWAERDVVLGNALIAPHTRHALDLEIRRVPDCGHFVQQEQPETVNRILAEWLLRRTR